MQVSFFMKAPPMQVAEVEYVSIYTGRDTDTVIRAATDADRERFADEYAAFKAPPPPPPEMVVASVESQPPAPLPE